MTVQPASINFKLYQNATFSEPVTLFDSNGDPIPLAGYTAKLQARRDISDALPVFELSTTDGSIVLGDSDGSVTLNLSAAATAALVVDWDGELWVHDLLLTHTSDSNAQRTYQGVIIASPAVTR